MYMRMIQSRFGSCLNYELSATQCVPLLIALHINHISRRTFNWDIFYVLRTESSVLMLEVRLIQFRTNCPCTTTFMLTRGIPLACNYSKITAELYSATQNTQCDEKHTIIQKYYITSIFYSSFPLGLEKRKTDEINFYKMSDISSVPGIYCT